MHTKSVTTAAGGYEYPITFNQFDSEVEALARVCRLGEEDEAALANALSPFEGKLVNATGVINAAQEQGAKQGGKEVVRSAKDEHGLESDEFSKAVAQHQDRAAKYILGAPRGSTGGMTKTKAADIGKEILATVGEEKLMALAAELGIDPNALK